MGATLALSKTHEEQEYIKQLTASSSQKNYWIGLTDPQHNGHWVWDDGSQLGQPHNWASNHPNVHKNWFCVVTSGDHHNFWLDTDCTTQRFYICQKPAFVANTTAAATTNPPQGCPTNWITDQNHCYLYSTLTTTWAAAKLDCAHHGAFLAVVKTQEEQDFLNSNAPSLQTYWLGLSDSVIEGTWFWEDNTLLGQPANWGQGEPDVQHLRNNDDCGVASYGPGSHGDWFDDFCNNSRHSHHYICQKPNTGTVVTSGTPITAIQATSPTSATTAVTTTLPPPVSCYNCTGLDCLIAPAREKCPLGEVCFTFMYEGEHGRDIERGCMPYGDCEPRNAKCDKAEDTLLPWHSKCTYCCIKDFCNPPPHLKPDPLSSLIN